MVMAMTVCHSSPKQSPPKCHSLKFWFLYSGQEHSIPISSEIHFYVFQLQLLDLKFPCMYWTCWGMSTAGCQSPIPSVHQFYRKHWKNVFHKTEASFPVKPPNLCSFTIIQLGYLANVLTFKLWQDCFKCILQQSNLGKIKEKLLGIPEPCVSR